MSKNLFAVVIILCFTNLAFSQNFITIKGKVIEKTTQLPLESATIYLSKAKDSTVIDYTISNKSGNFDIKTRKIETPFTVKISFIGFQTFSKEFKQLTSDIDLGTIELGDDENLLNEVIIKSEAPPIVIKKDTLEFNASSFKVRPDANVEALLKQLPGVEVTPEGKITVNGKEVNNILVNGKPFFGKDGKIATQNLPAEIIDKVQVVDTKTKSEELSGDASSSEEKTINLTIQEDKNKGFFGKVMGGYGSNDRYESSLLLNSFKGEQKISVLASSNNINSIGFSMDEIFDNMGGGRNSSVFYNDDGAFGINNMSFGVGKGITQSNLIGVNYQDTFDKKIETSGSYYFSNAESKNNNTTSRINLLPTGSTFTDSNSSFKAMSNNHNFSVDFEIKLDSTSSLYVTPKFSRGISKNLNSSQQITLDEFDAEMNRSSAKDYSETESSSFSSEIYYYKKFAKKNRGLTVSMDSEVSKRDEFLDTDSQTLFQDASSDDIRKQNRFEVADKSSFRLEARFGEPLTDSLRLSLTSQINIDRAKDNRQAFDFNSGTNEFDDFNEAQSNFIDSKTVRFFPSTGLIISKKKLNGRINFGPEFISFKNQSDYLGIGTQINKNYVFPKVTGYFNFSVGKSKSIYANYNYEVTLPGGSQVLPVENLANPLNTFLGNANLEPTKRQSVYMNYNNYDYATRSGFFVYTGFTHNVDQVVSSTIYDDNFKATTTYENVDLGYNGYLGASFNKSFNKDKRKLKLGVSFNVNLEHSEGLTNTELFESNGYQISPRLNLTWSIDDMITVAPSYRYSFFNTDYKNYVIDNAQNFTHNAKVEITSYLPKKFVIGNDFGYTYNSNIADGFKKDFYLWNTSIGYNFWKDQLLAKVKVYDVLNQNLNTRRTITPTAIIDSENTVLKRYVMFSLTYKLEKFGGKKKGDGGFMIFD